MLLPSTRTTEWGSRSPSRRISPFSLVCTNPTETAVTSFKVKADISRATHANTHTLGEKRGEGGNSASEGEEDEEEEKS